MEHLSRRQLLRASLSLAGLGLLLGCGLAPFAAPTKVPRIGLLSLTSWAGEGRALNLEAFLGALADLGYTEGRSIAFERRSADSIGERLAPLAAELVALQVDIIVTPSSPDTQVAKDATSTIPIVMASGGGDPVALGLAASLGRPGGNVTGVINFNGQLTPKRLEILRQILPTVSRIAVLWNATNSVSRLQFRNLQSVTQTVGVEIRSLEVRGPDDFEAALVGIERESAQALMVFADPLIISQQARIAEFTLKNRIPGIYEQRAFTASGGLISYGVGGENQWRRAAIYVDKILKGAKPGDLPIEQPTTFQFVINLKTAQALGLTIPQSVLMQATELIQ